MLEALNALHAVDRSDLSGLLNVGARFAERQVKANVELVPFFIALFGVNDFVQLLVKRGSRSNVPFRALEETLDALSTLAKELADEELVDAEELLHESSPTTITRRIELRGLEIQVFVHIALLNLPNEPLQTPNVATEPKQLTHVDPAEAERISRNVADLTIRTRQALSAVRQNCLLALDLVQAFSRTDEKVLRRTRVCEYAKCPKPFFLDASASKKGRFCSSAHRQAAHRVRHR